MQSVIWAVSVIYLFVDGIGFGENNPDKNPFTRYAKSFLAPLGDPNSENLPDGVILAPIDASLGVPGLPQSATGQTSLWTGINGPATLGHHMTGFPGPTLIKIIKEHSIVKVLNDAGRKASLVNAFSNGYMERIRRKPRLTGASTHVQLASGVPVKSLDDLENNKAIFMDITHEIMHQFFPDLKERFPVRDPMAVGKTLAEIARDYDLIVFEFFISDKAGHNQSFEEAKWVIETLERFFTGIRENMRGEDLLLMTSDHGNLEDLSTKTHTMNPVPLFAFGADAHLAPASVKSIQDFPNFIYERLGVPKIRAEISSHLPQ